MYKSDPKNVHTYTHPFRGVYGCIWICIFACMNNKFTIFYFLEYNLFNQPRNHFLIIGDLSMTGLVGYKPSRFWVGVLVDSLERQASVCCWCCPCSCTGDALFNHEELNPKRVLGHEKKTRAVLLAVLLAMRLRLG